MKQLICLIIYFFALTVLAVDVPATQSAVEVAIIQLKAAQKAYTRENILAQRTAIAAFDPIIKAAVDSGIHDNVNLWEKARDDFMHAGKFPENPPVDLKKALENYAEKKNPPKSLLEAYDAAIAALNAAGSVDRAKELQKQKDDLAPTTRPATKPAD